MKRVAIYNFCLLLMLTAGCSDFLTFPQESEVPTSSLDYTKKENMFAPVSNAYASLRKDDAHGFAYIGLCEIVSDDADKGSSPTDGSGMIELDAYSYGAANTHINSYWTGLFDIVSAANNAMHTLPNFLPIIKDETGMREYSGLVAESRFLRAYAYFCLVRTFGGVPLISSLQTAAELNSQPRAPQDSVYAFIHRDLTAAVQDLPESYTREWAGRVTRYAAMALKAKVFLYQRQWDSVAYYTDKVIASGRFDLHPDFYRMFRIDEENCEESLFELQSTSLGQVDGSRDIGLEYAYVQGPRGNLPGNMQGWGFKVPSQALISFLEGREEADRIKATIMVRGTVTPEGDSIIRTCANPYYNMKAYTPSSYNKWSYNAYGLDQNVRLLRYAEVLLIHAEALASGATAAVSMSLDEAMNKVRRRVHLTERNGYTINDIYDERRAELAMEENRFFDLVRTGRAESVLGPKGYTAKNTLFPIPQRQMELNPSLVQNPGY